MNVKDHDEAEAARCRTLFERLSEYLDGEVDPPVRLEIEAHLRDCAPCVRFAESLRRTVAFIGRLPRPRMTDELRREMVAACESALRRSSEPR